MEHLLLDILLDVCRLQHAPAAGSLDHLGHQFGVRDGLATLHDPDDRGLRLVVPIGSHALVRCLVLLLRLLQLDLIDLDPHLWVGKPGIVRKFVRRVDVPALWLLAEDSVLGAGQRLKCPFEFLVSWNEEMLLVKASNGPEK